MASNYVVESTPQVTVEGLVLGGGRKGGSEPTEDTDEKEEGEEEIQQEDSIEGESERVKKKKKNNQNKPLVLEETVRKHCTTIIPHNLMEISIVELLRMVRCEIVNNHLPMKR